jgi:hypothetical protein
LGKWSIARARPTFGARSAQPWLAAAPGVRYSNGMERRHPTLDRITFDPEKCNGKACIRGLRICRLVGE